MAGIKNSCAVRVAGVFQRMLPLTEWHECLWISILFYFYFLIFLWIFIRVGQETHLWKTEICVCGLDPSSWIPENCRHGDQTGLGPRLTLEFSLRGSCLSSLRGLQCLQLRARNPSSLLPSQHLIGSQLQEDGRFECTRCLLPSESQLAAPVLSNFSVADLWSHTQFVFGCKCVLRWSFNYVDCCSSLPQGCCLMQGSRSHPCRAIS